MPDEIRKHDEDFTEALAGQLFTHWDTVMVLVTRQEPDGRTVSYSTGRGNWYARYGQIQKWLADSEMDDFSCPITDTDLDDDPDDN